MKNAVPVLVVLCVASFVDGSYGTGILLLFLIVLALVGKPVTTGNLDGLRREMPTMWQNIPETLEIAAKHGFFDNGATFDEVANFYQLIEANPSLFEMKVAVHVVKMFENQNPLLRHHDPAFSSRTRAVYYYIFALEHAPDLMPLVAKMIEVRKKVYGEPKKEREERFLLPSFA